MTSPRSDQPSRFTYQCPKCRSLRVNRRRGACPKCRTRLYYAGDWIDPTEGGFLWLKAEARWVDIDSVEFEDLLDRGTA